MIRPALHLLATVLLVTAAIWFFAMAAIAFVLCCAGAATDADRFSGLIRAVWLLLSLAALSRVQRWRD